MRRSCALAALSIVFATGSGHAQWVKPQVNVTMVSRSGGIALEPDAVFVGDCLGLRGRLAEARFDLVAKIRFEASTPWYVSLESMARDKAGELGANCLEKRRSWGLVYPVGVSYRAYRFSQFHSYITGSAWLPVSRAELAKAVPSAGEAQTVPALTKSSASSTGPDTPLWTSGPFVFRFEIGLDLAKLPPAVWQDLQEDLGSLPASDFHRLLEAHARGEKVVIDFKHDHLEVIAPGPAALR